MKVVSLFKINPEKMGAGDGECELHEVSVY